jgi:hypothetical protein
MVVEFTTIYSHFFYLNSNKMRPAYLILLLLIGLASCKTIKIEVPPPAPEAPIKPEPITFPTTINATVTGTLEVNGNVSGNGYNITKSSEADAELILSDARTGNEDQRSCGTQWTQSQARSFSQIIPRHVPQGHIYGSAINVSTQARGGFWRGKVVIACKGSNDECGRAYAKATSFINLNYTAPNTIKDQLIIRINGDQNVSVQVSEVGGETLVINNTNHGKVVELPHSGAYTISSSKTTTTGSQCGGCPGCAQTTSESAEVLVQSLRDALNPVGSDELYQVPLPVFIPLSEIQKKLYAELFTTNGRFYPCPDKSDCGKYASEIYLEDPQLSVNGAFITLKVHLTGHGSFLLFRPGITGNIFLTATPVIENGDLKLKDMTLEVQSNNMILKYITSKFRDKLVDALKEHSSFPLQSKIDEVTEELKKQFPIKWGSACLLLDIEKIKLKQIYPKQNPTPGIIADFGISIKIEDESQCK